MPQIASGLVCHLVVGPLGCSPSRTQHHAHAVVKWSLNTLEVRHGLRSSTCESRWQDACICSLARQADACSALQWHRTPLWYNEGRPAPCAAAPALFQCHPVLSETPGMHQPMPVVTLLHTPDGGSYTKAPPAALILLSYTYCLNSLMVTCDPGVV